MQTNTNSGKISSNKKYPAKYNPLDCKISLLLHIRGTSRSGRAEERKSGGGEERQNQLAGSLARGAWSKSKFKVDCNFKYWNHGLRQQHLIVVKIKTI
ncbi:MAG: hypothetical protein ACLFN5_07045, partial [bacterium]